MSKLRIEPAGMGLDEGETIGAMLQVAPPTPALAHLGADNLGFAWIPEDDFVTHFAPKLTRSRPRSCSRSSSHFT